MDFYKAITTRYSVRNYSGGKINEEQWNLIFRAGFAAPSAHNLQPWHFVRIDLQEKLAEIASAHPYAKMLPSAGGAVLVCADLSVQERIGFAVEDCSAAMQNMLIAINGLNLGGLWIGIYPVESLIDTMRKIFDLPSQILPIGLIAVGHKVSDREPIDKYKPEKIHLNQW
jgi:nitroreductase